MKCSEYSARITRKNPSAFIFMLDLSGSMEDKITFQGGTKTKAEAVSLIINNIISELINHCKRENGYRDYLDIAVIGYGGEKVRSLLPEGGTHPIFRKPGELAYAKVDTVKTFRERHLPDGKTLITKIETKEWVKPCSLGKTPMFAAFRMVYTLIEEWTRKYATERCFPPVIINITDGEATDAEDYELQGICEKIRDHSTLDGNVLLMNIYISSDSNASGILFPSSEEQLPDRRYARLLFNMSSPMPAIYHEEIAEITGNTDVQGCRGMSYNCSMTDLVGMLNIGSISVTLLD